MFEDELDEMVAYCEEQMNLQDHERDCEEFEKEAEEGETCQN